MENKSYLIDGNIFATGFVDQFSGVAKKKGSCILIN